MAEEDKVERISQRLSLLDWRDLQAVLQEAASQFDANERHGNILDFIENGLDMLKSGEYIREEVTTIEIQRLVHRNSGI